jgi:hypothetical protein
MAEAKKGKKTIVWAWLILSVTLNISGIASIADSLVTWGRFFHDIIDVYRTLIREPLSWLVHLIWPSWFPRIPPWIFDLLVVWVGFWIAFNAFWLNNFGHTIIGEILFTRLGRARGLVISLRAFVFGPLIFLAHLARGRLWPRNAKLITALYLATLPRGRMYYLVLVAVFVVILFLNWQLKRIGW